MKTIKLDVSKLDDIGYCCIPNNLILNNEITNAQFRLLCYLLTHKTGFNFTINYLALELKTKWITIKSNLDKLESLNYIKIDNDIISFNQEKIVYQFIPSPKMDSPNETSPKMVNLVSPKETNEVSPKLDSSLPKKDYKVSPKLDTNNNIQEERKEEEKEYKQEEKKNLNFDDNFQSNYFGNEKLNVKLVEFYLSLPNDLKEKYNSFSIFESHLVFYIYSLLKHSNLISNNNSSEDRSKLINILINQFDSIKTNLLTNLTNSYNQYINNINNLNKEIEFLKL